MTKFLKAYQEPKGVQDKPAKFHPAEAEPPSSEALTQAEFLSADVTEPAVTPHTGGPVPGALPAGSPIPAAMGATSVGGHRDQTLFEAPQRDYDVPLDATVPISPLRCGFTDGYDEPVTPCEQLETDFTWNKGVKQPELSTDASSRHHFAPLVLTTAALALSTVGITINGWFARSLGASDVAGWLFLAIGVAADLVAFVMPSCVAGLWQAGQRATALVAWVVWLITFAFAVTAGIGFASTNISDVTLARASRVTPTVTTAQAALSDAMAARDRECKGGVGQFCREREAGVTERRRILDAVMASVGQAADPQTDAAIRLIAWSSGGRLRPAPEDFAMIRLILLALLPQVGGILMMVGSNSRVQRDSALRRRSTGRPTKTEGSASPSARPVPMQSPI